MVDLSSVMGGVDRQSRVGSEDFPRVQDPIIFFCSGVQLFS